MLAKTCFITSIVPDVLDLTTGNPKKIELTGSTSDATFTAESNNEAISAQVVGKELTISATGEGNAIVTIKASANGMASWETTIAV